MIVIKINRVKVAPYQSCEGGADPASEQLSWGAAAKTVVHVICAASFPSLIQGMALVMLEAGFYKCVDFREE